MHSLARAHPRATCRRRCRCRAHEPPRRLDGWRASEWRLSTHHAAHSPTTRQRRFLPPRRRCKGDRRRIVGGRARCRLQPAALARACHVRRLPPLVCPSARSPTRRALSLGHRGVQRAARRLPLSSHLLLPLLASRTHDATRRRARARQFCQSRSSPAAIVSSGDGVVVA